MKTTDAVIGQWSKVFEYYGLPPVTGKKHYKGKCPICGQKGKYRCDDKGGRGTFICVCNIGDGWKLLALTQKKDFKAQATEVDEIIGNTYAHQPESVQSSVNKDDRSLFRDKVIRKYSTLVNLRGTPGESYLRNRGINCLPAEQIRYCNHQPVRTKVFQAMYSLATDDKGALCYLHRTLLEGDKKANMDLAKQTYSLQSDDYLKHTGSVAIRMFPVSSTLGISEGIETALSCKQIYGCNTWPVMNAGFMGKFRVPNGVKHLIIFADMDLHSATGHAAAFECARGNLVAKNDLETVSIRWPDHGDFNDMLLNGDEVRELSFNKWVE
ncbi:toprim domain-containing protein [Photorhabdus temperata]|uniref:DNA primase/helicase Gp4 N-terminal Bacteriophage T7-like domain-containing protein n=2 Tax=Photorhabdus temperata TaxID=574560 RepID=A0A081RQU8_PHOTE|nr:toprim domain-containing protein [Photorhabdus temperata]KER01051.1 hypothetical protein MEG1DRAFT_04322 [Photorhabdus temperata subsp. temperata Meg1]